MPLSSPAAAESIRFPIAGELLGFVAPIPAKARAYLAMRLPQFEPTVALLAPMYFWLTDETIINYNSNHLTQ